MQVNANSHKTATKSKKYKYNDNLYSYIVDDAILLRLDPEIDNAKTATSGQTKQAKKYKWQSKKYNCDNFNLYSYVTDRVVEAK